jgi:PAS domain S-box-containing protein
MTDNQEYNYNDLLQSAYNQIDAMLAYWDKNQICRFANNAYLKWFGRSYEEMVINKITLKELLGENFYQLNLPYINGALAGNIQKFEWEIPTPNGQIKHALASYFPDIKNGEVCGFFVHVADISEKRITELALKKRDEQNRIFIEQSPNAIAMFDKELKYIAASQKWIEDYRLEKTTIIGKSHYEIFPEIGDDWKKIHQECLAGAINTCQEACFERNDGTIQWISWDVRPWYINDSEMGGLLMCTADITLTKEREKVKNRIEEILEKTNKIAKIGTWELNLFTNEVTWSSVTKVIHEVPEDYKPNLESAINFYKDDSYKTKIREAIENSAETGNSFDIELEITTFKNNHIWVRTIGQAEFKKGKCVKIYGIFQDINETKKNKEAIKKLNDYLNTIINTGHVSIIGTDLNGTINLFNEGAEKLLQYSANELIGKYSPAIIHTKDEIIKRSIELSKELNKEIIDFDVLVEIPKRQKYEAREWTYVRKDGTQFPVQLVVTTIFNKMGEKTGYLGIATDISEIKNKESEMKSLLDITIDQNERLKNFAHIVSHNLRSHSANFEMTLQLIEEEYPEIATIEYFPLLTKSAINLKETIKNLNEVVEMNTTFQETLIPINLYDTLVSTIGNVALLAAEASTTIVNNIDKNCIVLGIQAYLDSITLNFITNGIKYRKPNKSDSKIVVSCYQSNEFIVIQFEDNGLGIDLNKNKTKLFGMYKTFHGNKDARGIGLFITKNQVEAMGGRIEVESEINKGTTFRVFLKHP